MEEMNRGIAPAENNPATDAENAPAPGSDTPKPRKAKKVLAVVAGLMLLLSTATSVLYLADRFGGYGIGEGGPSGPTKEDGVVIADDYPIESTLPISDAYKSGDASGLDDKQKAVLDAASAVIDEIIKDGMTDLEKETAIYEWMVKNIPLDEGMTAVFQEDESGNVSTGAASAGTPYGALVEHKAVCAGYATTFRLFMQMMDIECMVIHSDDLVHSWDLVKIDDAWYHVDIYSDVNGGMYGNFNVSDDMVMQEWDTSFFPAATSLDANVSYKERVKADSVYEVPDLVRKALEDRKGRLFIEFTDGQPADKQDLAVYMVNAICMDIDYMNPLGGTPYQGRWIPEKGGDGTLFSVEFMYVDNQDTCVTKSTNLDDESREKADEALKKAFGDLNETIRIDDGVY